MKLKVKFIDAAAHKKLPDYYPEVGTIGEIECVLSEIPANRLFFIHWPNGSTSFDDFWCADSGRLSYFINNEWLTFEQVKAIFGGTEATRKETKEERQC